MEERERMLDTIMEMQRWNGIKDNQIEQLKQENQALKEYEQKYLKLHQDYEELQHCIWKDKRKLEMYENFMEENEFADIEEVKDILDNAQTLFTIWEIVKEHYGNEVIDIVEKELKKEDEC